MMFRIGAFALSAMAAALFASMSVGGTLRLAAQSPNSSAKASAKTLGESQGAAPFMTAEFTVPSAPVDLQTLHLLRACQSKFERSIRLAMAATHTGNNRDNRGDDRRSADSALRPVPSAAIATGRECLGRLGDMRALAPLDLPALLRIAVGADDDALVQQTIARQLTVAGSVVRDRGQVLETAIDLLLHNTWNDRDREGVTHRTTAHDSLARHYAAMLDTMRPAGQVVASRLRAMAKLDVALAPAVWNVDEDLAQARAHLRVAMSVSMRDVPAKDTAEVRASRTPIAVAWLTYLQTPTHANLARWIAVRDSMLHLPRGQTMDSLLNRPAPRLDADYWFNVPAGVTTPTVPAAGVMSLLVFGSDLSAERADRLRQLHARYPALRIVLVAMTPLRRSTDSLRMHPERDAAQIWKRLSDDLRAPGIVCVLETRYHTDSATMEIPIASPIMDRFRLDPRDYAGHLFLIDAQGVLVNDRTSSILDGKLIQRLTDHP